MDNSTDFSGAARLKQGISPAGVYLDRPDLLRKDELSQPRSATVATSSVTWSESPTAYTLFFMLISLVEIEGPKSAGVERSNTSPFNGRENSNMAETKFISQREYTSPLGVKLSRSNTQISLARASPNAIDPASRQGRGALKRLSTSMSSKGRSFQIYASDFLLNSNSLGQDSPITEFYNGYASMESSPIEPGRSAPISGSADRVWPRNNGPPTLTLSRSTSRSVQNAPSNMGGGSVIRQFTRKMTPPRRNRSPQNDEEGYGSDNYDVGYYDLSLIRVKVSKIADYALF
jgi:hypothetical protein